MLREALGVPTNIKEVASDVFNEFVNKLRDELNKYPDINTNPNIGGDSKITLGLFNKGYEISDYKFNILLIDVELFKTNKVNDAHLTSLSFNSKKQLDTDTLKATIIDYTDKVRIGINIAIPETISNDEIISNIIREKTKYVSSIAHELKHAYDAYKKPSRDVSDIGDYSIYANTTLGIPAIDEFIHNLYFTHIVENLVVPSELASEMAEGNISKVGFIEFLSNNNTYNRFKKLSNYTLDDLKNELLNQTDVIVTQVRKSGLNIPEDILNDDNKLVEYILHLTYMTLFNLKVSKLKTLLTTSIVDEMLGFMHNDVKANYFKDYINKLEKQKNWRNFFENEIKMFNFVGGKMMRKIHKLYDMAKDDKKLHNIIDKINSKNTNESIKNWDLYYEQNKIKETKLEDKKREG